MTYDMKTPGAAVATITVGTTQVEVLLASHNTYALSNVGAGTLRFTTDGTDVDTGDNRVGLGRLDSLSTIYGFSQTITGVDVLKLKAMASAILIITRSSVR